MARDYDIVDDFPGYRAREEETKLKPGFLVYPSMNVITNVAGRVQSVPGYTLDGAASSDPDNGIQSNYDFDNKRDARRNIRAGFLTSAANDGKVQYRYKSSDRTITWYDILTGLSSCEFSFTSFWDTTDLVNLCLFANGNGNIYEWNGAVATFSAATVNTITIQGTLNTIQAGFYSTRDKQLVLGGITYTYTGATGSQFTGVTPDPTAGGHSVGDVLHQKVVTNAVSGFSGTGVSSFLPSLIKRGVKNQLYIAAADSNQVFVSKVNDFSDYAYSAPLRVVGEGFVYNLDAPPRAFIPQETGNNESAIMLISAGKDYWYREISTIQVNSTAGTATEQLELKPLRNAKLQGVLHERAASRVKNGVAFLGNDNVVNLLGQISNQYVPEMTDLSYSIINDMLGYDFTDAAVFYHRNFLYMTVPAHGIIRAYNMSDPERQYWEAPIQYPISDFYVTEDGEIGGHGYGSSESYLLFAGNRFRANPDDDGFPINAIAVFSPTPHKSRVRTKTTEEVWVDGYMSANTTLYLTLGLGLDGCKITKVKSILGNDPSATCPISEGGSFGDSPFGTQILGDGLVSPSRPPYFNKILTFDKTESAYRFEQVAFSSGGYDEQWEIISFASDAEDTREDNNDIRE